jgi:conjugative relaxase-like TrwC/TraI family protein
VVPVGAGGGWGYGLTFSPVKSVSTLCAIADLPIAALIGQAHHSALAEALRFIEDRAPFTREGRGGVRQVDVTGLVAAAFTHRDSRAGDPDLHTHVALANKVQTLDGRWLSIDGRVLHGISIAASVGKQRCVQVHKSRAVCSAPADAAAFCSVVGGGLTGGVLLALDFVGG